MPNPVPLFVSHILGKTYPGHIFSRLDLRVIMLVLTARFDPLFSTRNFIQLSYDCFNKFGIAIDANTIIGNNDADILSKP